MRKRVFKVFGTILGGHKVEKFIYLFVHIMTGDGIGTPKPQAKYLFIFDERRENEINETTI